VRCALFLEDADVRLLEDLAAQHKVPVSLVATKIVEGAFSQGLEIEL
jgi:hypothetical protein